MTEQQIPFPFRKPARLSAAQRKAMIQTKFQDYPVYQAAVKRKRKHHVIEQVQERAVEPMRRISGTCRWKPLRASVERVSAACWSCLKRAWERMGRTDWRKE